jgi:hypothetical protein
LARHSSEDLQTTFFRPTQEQEHTGGSRPIAETAPRTGSILKTAGELLIINGLTAQARPKQIV